ncbi:MAG: hypothetical protein ACFFCS_19535 [Candidatus Hodarchaeota archaeon]
MEEREAQVIIPKKKRYNFIDQFRGIVIFLFVVAAVTYEWSGNAGIGLVSVGPTWLNHGWKFFDFNQKQIITLIDLGQMLFVFVMGLMIPLSWKRHMEKGGIGNAIGQTLVRIGWFYLIAGIMDDFDPGGMFLRGTFGVLAAAMIMATILAAIIKDPTKRFYVNMGLLVLLTVLYALPAVRTLEQSIFGVDDSIELLPLNLLGASIVAIQGGIFMEWFVQAKENPDILKQKILKVSLLACIVCVPVDYFWYADHHAMNTSLVLMGIGVGGFLFMIFYMLEKNFKWSVPGLNAFGRNTLLAFMITAPIEALLWGDGLNIAETFKDLSYPYPISAAIGLLTLVIYIAWYLVILVPLDRKQWYFTPSIFIRAIKYGIEKNKKKKAKETPQNQ